MLADVSQPNLLASYIAMPEDSEVQAKTKVARRNQILRELIMIVDQNYESFETRYYGADASVNFAGDVLNLGLTGVSSVTGTAHLKSVLSAIATGTTGMKTSYQKNYFDQQTRAAVVQQMRAQRSSQLARLEDENHMKAGVSSYSLEQGLSDIDGYYNAGTIIGALQAISEAAGSKQQQAQSEQRLNSAKRQTYQ